MERSRATATALKGREGKGLRGKGENEAAQMSIEAMRRAAAAEAIEAEPGLGSKEVCPVLSPKSKTAPSCRF